jgi:hypothetical protein
MSREIAQASIWGDVNASIAVAEWVEITPPGNVRE